MAEMDQFKFQSYLSELEDLAQRGIELGTSSGASQIEILLSNGYTRSIEIKANSINGVQHQSATKVSVRAYIGKKLGMARSTSLSRNSIEDAVTTAIQLAKLAPEDDNFQSLATPLDRTPAQVNQLFDEKIANLDPADILSQTNDLIQGAQEHHQLSNVSGKIDIRTQERVVVNSLGVSANTQSTSITAYSYISIPVEPTNVGVGFEFTASRVWGDIDFYELGKTGAKKAEQMLGAKLAPSKKMPVIFDERATGQTLQAILGMGVSGYAVMTGISYYADKIGEQVASSGLTAWDDPHVDNGLGSKIFDIEGTPTTRVDLVKDGVLLSYVTDSYTSNKLGLENTGNANSGMRSTQPRPQIHQLQLGAGEDSFEAMLADMKEGILVESGVNPAGGSPNISSQINRGFYVLNGEIQYPLKNSMLGSDVFSLLKGITGISKDLRVEFGRQYPAMMVREVSIAGAGEKKQGPQVTMSSI